MSLDARTAPCPHCAEPAILNASNPWRPFCSERCKLVDLNGWFSGEFVIPGDSIEHPSGDEDL